MTASTGAALSSRQPRLSTGGGWEKNAQRAGTESSDDRQPGDGSRTIFAFGYGADAPSPFSTALARLDKNHDGQLSPDEYQDIPGDSPDRQVAAVYIAMGKFMGNRDGM